MFEDYKNLCAGKKVSIKQWDSNFKVYECRGGKKFYLVLLGSLAGSEDS